MDFNLPNQLTILRILLTPVFFLLMIQDLVEYRILGTFVFFAASATDWYDGYIARKRQEITRWGQFMDPLADKLLISSAFVIFALLGLVYTWMVVVIIARDFLITFLRIFALNTGKSIVTSILAKWKTFLQMAFVFVTLIYLCIPDAGYYRPVENPPGMWHWITVSMSLVTFLTAYTGIQYIVENRGHLLELVKRTINFFTR